MPRETLSTLQCFAGLGAVYHTSRRHLVRQGMIEMQRKQVRRSKASLEGSIARSQLPSASCPPFTQQAPLQSPVDYHRLSYATHYPRVPSPIAPLQRPCNAVLTCR